MPRKPDLKVVKSPEDDAARAAKWEKARKLHDRVNRAKAEHKATGEELRDARKALEELFNAGKEKPAEARTGTLPHVE
jgi:hypothetical protein